MNAHPSSSPHCACAFQRRGFYLHGCWVYDHPFSVRTWSREDFSGMFELLRRLGFNTVMMWPTPETAPMPLSDEDASTLTGYRRVIDDARSRGLECWVVYCPSVISSEEVRVLPWHERSLYSTTQIIRAGDGPDFDAYLKHRQAVIRLMDHADAFVVIDGDPGGYAGASVDEFVRILENDREALPNGRVIPWLWNGWGRDAGKNSSSYWQEPVLPHIRETLDAIKRRPGPDWEFLPGRSHREGWANGRVPLAETDRAGFLPRSTIMCYEAIEFEPSEPAAVLQFDIIRSVLREERTRSAEALGVMGNAQQPITVLPNLYFFARGAADPSYLEKTDDEVLADFARELGDDTGVLPPAWKCLQLPLDELSLDHARRIRTLKLESDLARCIPGGPGRYVEIMAEQYESRRALLVAVSAAPSSARDAAVSLADGATALLRWWNVHHYVGAGRKGDPFQWRFIRSTEVEILRAHANHCFAFGPSVLESAASILAENNILPKEQAMERFREFQSQPA